jgi:hypothetical protein
LIRTVVLFPSVDFAQVSGMVQGIHGQADELACMHCQQPG